MKRIIPAWENGFFRHNAGVVYQELRREVICAVDDEIVVLDDVEDILAVDECAVGVDSHIRIYGFHGFLCGLHLCLADVGSGVYHLALEVGEIHLVRVSDADGAYSRSREVKRCRGAKSTGADDEHL